MSGHVDAAAAWIYRGVWATIVSWFRVPADPPTLPATGEPVRSIRPADGYLRYLKFLFWVALIPGDILPIVGWTAIALAVPVLGAVLAVPALALVVLPDVVAYVGIHLRYDTTWYVLTDRSLRIRRGILNIHETTISFENVQNVEVRQGPLQRYFGIADVLVTTAGGGASSHGKGGQSSSLGAHVGLLQGLDDAELVRNQSLACVERTRAAGLGDEDPRELAISARADAPHALSPRHVAVLREVPRQRPPAGGDGFVSAMPGRGLERSRFVTVAAATAVLTAALVAIARPDGRRAASDTRPPLATAAPTNPAVPVDGPVAETPECRARRAELAAVEVEQDQAHVTSRAVLAALRLDAAHLDDEIARAERDWARLERLFAEAAITQGRLEPLRKKLQTLIASRDAMRARIASHEAALTRSRSAVSAARLRVQQACAR